MRKHRVSLFKDLGEDGLSLKKALVSDIKLYIILTLLLALMICIPSLIGKMAVSSLTWERSVVIEEWSGDTWVYSRTIHTFGDTSTPEWGEYELVDNERVLSQSEEYVVTLNSINCNRTTTQYKYRLPYEVWETLSIDEVMSVCKVFYNEWTRKFIQISVDRWN